MPSENGQGSTVSQPKSSGATSRQSLGELPTVAGEVFNGKVTLAVLPLGRRLKHPCSICSGALELGFDVVHPHPDEVGHETFVWWLLIATDVGHDHRPVGADAQLRPVALAYPGALDEAEGLGQPGDRRPYIGIDEHGNDRRGRCGPVPLHVNLGMVVLVL